MKLAIIGSRKFNNYNLLCQNIPTGITEIISGGAKGADALAERFAQENNLPTKILLPRFQTDPNVGYHPGHYHQRNRQIVESADKVLAFMPKSGSNGTQSTINHAKKTNTPYTIIHF